MAITNTRLTTINPTTVFEAVGQQAITVMYITNTTATPVSFNMFVINSDDKIEYVAAHGGYRIDIRIRGRRKATKGWEGRKDTTVEAITGMIVSEM